MEQWTIWTGPGHEDDAAMAAAIEDLQAFGEPLGLAFQRGAAPPGEGNLLVVGDEARNPAGWEYLEKANVHVDVPEDAQGFAIRTRQTPCGRVMAVVGGGLEGDVYGLYWVWDRIRVHRALPVLDETRCPALRIRLVGPGAGAGLRNGLRHTANWVSDGNVTDLTPWNSEAEAAENARHRDALRPVIEQAHRYHMKFLAVSDEFAYHPSLMQEFGATPDPDDPKLWDAVQAKYRRFFEAMPEADGVQIRTGEHTRIGGPYHALDVMHCPSRGDVPLDERYRTFVKKMHEVVVGEFGKIYFHRTWVTNETEQHARADVYKAIFTDDVPTDGLYLSPYLSTTDRWYYQPYNPTFNCTPHNMLVLLARLDYHSDGSAKILPSFPGQYYQGGLRQILAPEDTNVKGTHFNVPRDLEWGSDTVTAYTIFRLAWEPELDLRTIAEDYAAIYCGRDAAPDVAEMLLLTHRIYKDGIYIKPVAEQLLWNTLPHLRLTTYEAQGIPRIDRGREHIAWLKDTMYEPSRGRTDEALEYFEKGRAAVLEAVARCAAAKDTMSDAAFASELADSAALTRWLVETNRLYVKTCYDYFGYREDPTEANRAKLADTVAALESARAGFMKAPGFDYKLFGIDILLDKAKEALDDLALAEKTLADAPDADGTLEAIAAQQAQHAEALKTHAGEAVKFLAWSARIDGKDLVSVRGNDAAIDHIQDDGPQSVEYEFFEALPDRPVTVLVKDLGSTFLHPFVLEQPTAENDYTLKLFIQDKGRGYGAWKLELYYLDQPPEALGLEVPWQ